MSQQHEAVRKCVNRKDNARQKLELFDKLIYDLISVLC